MCISLYQISPIKNIRWIDIHTNPEALSEIDASLNQVRERLYIKDLNGQLNVGIDSFIYLWSQTNEQRWLAKLFRFPVFNQFSRWMYNFFAKLLYHWNCSKRHW
jgi:predicted DCC family thiol-disulfide oxidoreductase YuxK